MEDGERRTAAAESHAQAVPWPLPGTPDDLGIWRLDLDLGSPVPEPVLAWLDGAERARMDRFQRLEDQVRFGVTRATLKRLLASHAAGVAAAHGRQGGSRASGDQASAQDPPSVLLTYTDTGRPVWRGSGLSFNVAHSGAVALIAISSSRLVGIDVELRKDLDIDALAPIVLTAHERRRLEQVPAIARREAFYRYWVCKEAALKAAGRGIGDALQRIELRADTAATDMHRIRCEDAGMADRRLLQSLRLRLLPLAGDYAGAVAWGSVANAA